MIRLPLLLVAGILGANDPVKTDLMQVSPEQNDKGVYKRSKNQPRAVVLIHGLRPELNGPLGRLFGSAQGSYKEAQFQDWQRPGSLLVKELGKNSDVFSVAYSQNVSLEAIVAAPEFHEKLKSVHDLGYSKIVLLGHSAGALIARIYTEDYPNPPVAMIIQVCAPNGGFGLAGLSRFAAPGQEAFVKSLSVDAREAAARQRLKKLIPQSVQFICVVGSYGRYGDGILTCNAQWPVDLQKQKIPAIKIPAAHFTVMRQDNSILRIADLVAKDHPRWDNPAVESFQQSISRLPFTQQDYLAMIEAVADKAQQEGDVDTLVECAYALATVESPEPKREPPMLKYLDQAAEITIARQNKDAANHLLESAGFLQALVPVDKQVYLLTLASGKKPSSIIEGEVVAALTPINRIGRNLFDPEIKIRAVDKQIAFAIGKGAVLAVHPSSQDIVLKKQTTLNKNGKLVLTIELAYRSYTGIKHTALIGAQLVHTEGRPRIVDLTFDDQTPFPTAYADRLRAFANAFNERRP